MRSRTTGRRSLAALALLLLCLVQLAPAPPAALAQIGASPGAASASLVDCIRPGRELAGGTFESSPRFAVTCFAALTSYRDYNDPDNTGTEPGNAPRTEKAVVTFGDAKVASTTQPGVYVDDPSEYHGDVAALVGDVGSVYGLAWSSGENPAALAGGRTRRLYVGAYTKRATRYGAWGPGAIYAVSSTIPPTVQPYVYVPNVVPGPLGAPYDMGGPDAQGYTPPLFVNGAGASGSVTLGGVHSLYADTPSVSMAGRSSLGDVDLDPDERYLYAVNLNSKRVVRFDTWSSAPQSTLALLPAMVPALNPCSQRGGSANYRPFGLLVTRAALYVGGVCSAETTGARADLGARVDRLDLRTQQWENMFGVGLTSYDAQRSYATTRDMGWQAWSNDPLGGYATGSGHHIFPQPLLADLELDEQGNMLLGFRDRYADVTGTDTLTSSIPGGDLLTAPASGSVWVAPATGPSAEHFDDYRTFAADSDKVEVASGALAYIPGTHGGGYGGEVITTWLDPYQSASFGAAWFDVRSGGRPKALQELYAGYKLRYFGKAEGLGDLELLCSWAALGDRVWDDANANGVQDAGERGLSGVVVQLFDAADTGFTAPLASVTTGDLDGDGQGGDWRFYVPPWRSYTIRLETSQLRVDGPLAGWSVSARDQGADDGRDSDADPVGRWAPAAALSDQEQNTSIDIGLTRAPGTGVLGGRVWSDLNGDGVQGAGEPGVPGVSVSLLVCEDPALRECAWRVVAGASADSGGRYSFGSLSPAYYVVSFGSLPVGASFTLPDVGPDDTRDSDVIASASWTKLQLSSWGSVSVSVDAGLVMASGDLLVGIDGPAAVLYGAAVSYSVRAVGGTAAAQGVALTVQLPAAALSVSAPGATRSGSTLLWSVGALAAGATAARSFDVTYAAPGEYRPTVAVSSSPPDSNTANNTASAATLVTSPNIAVSVAAPASASAGESFMYRITVSNAGAQRGGSVPSGSLVSAQGVTLVASLPPGLEYTGFSSSAAALVGNAVEATGARTLTWSIGSIPRESAQVVDVAVRARDVAPLPMALTASAIVSSSPTTPADAPGDNQASAVTMVSYPDLAVDITAGGSDGPATSGEGAQLVYTVTYSNRGAAQAADSRISVTLPAALALGTPSNGGYATSGGGRTLTWNLGTLAPGAGGTLTTLPVSVATGAAASSPLVVVATAETSTPELASANNSDTFRTDIVPPPAPPPIGDSLGLQLAIHSDLDPRSRDGSDTNAVYRSTGTQISWPAGEVLDLTPRVSITLPALAPAAAQLYELRARVTGWSLTAFEAGGRRVSADGSGERAADALGRAGCRQGSALSPELAGCAYPYIGGQSAADVREPTESQMAAQAHVYWAAAPPLAMRPDVYVFAVGGLGTARLSVQVAVTVDVVARGSGVVVRSEAQRREQTFAVRLTAPRSTR